MNRRYKWGRPIGREYRCFFGLGNRAFECFQSRGRVLLSKICILDMLTSLV